MSRAFLALLLTAAGLACARQPDPLAVLSECPRHLDSSLDVGYERIALRCPELAPALEHGPWAAWLPPDWNEPHNQLSAEDLHELHYTLARESAAVPGTRVLHPESAAAVVQRLTQKQVHQQGWWTHFKNWLRELLTPRPEQASNWWRRLFGDDVQIDQAALRLITQLAIALLIAMALAVVINELRLAGLFGRRRTTPQPGAPTTNARAPELADLDRADPRAQPALLLELITARLAAQDRLPAALALTVRELTTRARLGDGGQRARLTTLAAVSERVRYGAREIAPQVLLDAVRGGRELLSALDAQPASAAV